MCIICECNTRLTREEFNSCFTSNSHGAGFAWRADNINHYIKGFMERDAAWEAYQNVPVPHVAHFRLASAGGVCPALTHPFIVSMESPVKLSWDGPEALLFHNGTISGWKDMLFSLALQIGLPDGDMSDTRFVAMAMSVPILGDRALNFFHGGKFAMLDTAGTIQRIGMWEQHEGNWYSNSGYQSRTYVSTARDWPAYARGYGYGGYGAADDEDIPVARQFCYNCKHKKNVAIAGEFIGRCAPEGNLTNNNRCVEWEVKRGPGRPKKKGRGKGKGAEPEQGTLILSAATPGAVKASRSCHNCTKYLGELKCSLREYRMVNTYECAKWERKEAAKTDVEVLPDVIGSEVRKVVDADGNVTYKIESRRAL
jgi:hypothetical protein